MQRAVRTVALALALAGALVAVAFPAVRADEPSAFDRIGARYETIRRALLRDTTEGVAAAAGEIERELGALEGHFSARAAGTVDGAEEELLALLPTIRTATDGLREAADLETARERFGNLSEAMVRFRRLVDDPTSVVVYCSMAERVWLQPKGELGNPYLGQGMARCGEVVSE